jgi:hypothetical protein
MHKPNTNIKASAKTQSKATAKARQNASVFGQNPKSLLLILSKLYL